MPRRILLMVLVLVGVAYFVSGLRLIRPGERAVVRRFGKVLDEKPGPGLWVGLPWGMDRVDRVPVNLIRRVEVGYQPETGDDGATTPTGQLLTGDHNLINVRVALDYVVSPDEEEIVKYLLQADRADKLLSRALESFLAEWAAARRIDDILVNGKPELSQILVAAIQERIQDYHLGIQVQVASVPHLLPPNDVKPAFDDVTRAQAAIRTQEEEALRVAGTRLADAQRFRYTQEQLAATYSQDQHRQAQADADRFDKRRSAYWLIRDKNPDALSAIWWEEMGRLFAQMKKDGRLDLLDHHLAGDRLDITMFPPLPRKK